MSPITTIQGDLIKLAQLVGDGSLHAPEFHRKSLAKKCDAMLSKYKIKKARWPAWILRELRTGSAIGKPAGYDQNNRHPDFD